MAGSLVARYALPPEAIEALSLERLEAAVGGRWPWPEPERSVARRMCYAAGDAGLVGLIAIHPAAVRAGLEALRAGAELICDVRMVVAGLDHRRAARLGCPVRCVLDDGGAEARAAAGVPRVVEAVRGLGARLDGSICVIGTAPTALLALLDEVDAGRVRPALVIGTPVGFVAAAEAKEELVRRDVPYVTIRGPRGGAALAAAAANALLRLAAP